jgi:hypothetical protein
MEALETIDAFLDREQVDPGLLKQALSTEEGRQYLVDLLTLRELTVDQVPPEQVATGSRMPSSGRVVAMAAAIVLSVGGGFVVGQHFDGVLPDRELSSSPVVIEVIQPPSAPTPTHVIQLEPGVNWKNEGGD